MRISLFIYFCAAVCLTVPISVSAGFISFGGAITLIRPCYNFSAFQIIIGPPTPMSLIYQAGASFSYREGPPAHVGQWLLGTAGGIGLCDISPRRGFQRAEGLLINFHGSSK